MSVSDVVVNQTYDFSGLNHLALIKGCATEHFEFGGVHDFGQAHIICVKYIAAAHISTKNDDLVISEGCHKWASSISQRIILAEMYLLPKFALFHDTLFHVIGPCLGIQSFRDQSSVPILIYKTKENINKVLQCATAMVSSRLNQFWSIRPLIGKNVIIFDTVQVDAMVEPTAYKQKAIFEICKAREVS